MAGEKTIKLLGVAHEPAFAAAAAYKATEVLKKYAKPGEVIAIELDPPSDIKTFEKIFESKKDFPEAFKPYFMDWIRKLIKPDYIIKMTGITPGEVKKRIDIVLSKAYKDATPQALVFYKSFCLAKEKGLKIESLGLPFVSAVIQRPSIAPKLAVLTLLPVKERFVVSKIMRLKPDFVLVGSGHLEEIKNRLRKNKIKTKTILYMKPPHQLEEAKEVRKIRSEYWQRRKQMERMRLGLKKRI